MTTDIRNFKWSAAEKKIARKVYDRAYKRECTEIFNKVKHMMAEAADPRDIWKVEDYLEKKRIDISAKYDYRYSVLILVFGRLMREGFVEETDLSGLDQEKIERIKAIGSNYRLRN